ncbi:MAG: Gfo/Idh/MocA family oxidoreductase, partial [Patescibacteria group bacterium]|nr:Gfo/Idh/MocA family oxidoreductase [Patescibacteria group bacterium]
MDYTASKLGFQVRKALRYVGLYGPRRTWVKVFSQYHMKRRCDVLPAAADPAPPGGHVGLIGCGNFAYSTIAYYVRAKYGRVIRGVMDTDPHRAASLGKAYGARYHTDDAERLLADPEIDLVYIASNHASHAEYAIRALALGKHVHIEKPHVVNPDQLVRLCRAMTESAGRVSLGFNRPLSPIGRTIQQYLASQSGPAMLNWFIAGHEIAPDHWYFHEDEGGRVLGNLCHWTDFVLQMIEPARRYPITITPTRGRKSDCDIAVTYVFGDESIAAITFSAKGHTFEGVRERFAAHRGDVLISMDDFSHLTVEVVDRKRNHSSRFRDHGHQASICRSYAMSRPG